MTLSKKIGLIVLAGISGGILLLVIVFPSLFGLPVVSLVNRSHFELRSVQVEGTGFSVMLPAIPPGKSRSIVVKPKGESGISISFKANGKDFKTENLSYIEPFGGYCVTIEIGIAFKITANAQLSCFSLRRAFH